jgi:hypothetical protein
MKFDLSRIESGYDTVFGGSAVFGATGLSFKLGNKFLEYGERSIDKDNLRELFQAKIHRVFHNGWSGSWDDLQDYDEFLVNEGLKIGLCFEVSLYLYMYIMLTILKGAFSKIYPALDKLSKIYDEYDYNGAKEH